MKSFSKPIIILFLLLSVSPLWGADKEQGRHEAWLNGKRVGDECFAAVWTEYNPYSRYRYPKVPMPSSSFLIPTSKEITFKEIK